MKASRKPARFREGWSRETDALARQRTRVTRLQYSRATTTDQKKEANRASRQLTKQIKRVLKREKHENAQAWQHELLKAANKRDPAAISRRIARYTRAAREDALLGDVLDPAEFTKYFTETSKPPNPIPLRQFTLEPKFCATLETAIRKSKKGNAPGPDGIPTELYKICPPLFADVLFEILAACGRLGTYIPAWVLSILIPIYKKGDPVAAKNYRPLRFVQSSAKIVGIAVDDNMRKDASNNLAQFGFQARTSALKALVLAISHLQLPGPSTP